MTFDLALNFFLRGSFLVEFGASCRSLVISDDSLCGRLAYSNHVSLYGDSLDGGLEIGSFTL